MEVALDFALQCAPDHPWVAAHPEWFTVRPDGTIAYAENPPKKYQDIYPVNFDNDPAGIYAESLRVVLYWIEHGVRIFRVDNPHTKPPDFWHWLIWQVKSKHPDVLFLAEAFTRPARLFGLARLGFTQSYTYFTWRTTKPELTEFALMHAERADECRPNLFVNTPDILHESLQTGGPAMFAIRATLASTLSPTWGVYSGYELFEYEPVAAGQRGVPALREVRAAPARLQRRAWPTGSSLEPYITRLNEIRRRTRRCSSCATSTSTTVDNDPLIAYSKTDPATGDTVLVVCTLDPHHPQAGTTALDMPALGLDWNDRFQVHDEVAGGVYDWGQLNFVRLEPWRATSRTCCGVRPIPPGSGADRHTDARPVGPVRLTAQRRQPAALPHDGRSLRTATRAMAGNGGPSRQPPDRRPAGAPRLRGGTSETSDELRARPHAATSTTTGSSARCSTRCWSGRSSTPTATAPATCAG